MSYRTMQSRFTAIPVKRLLVNDESNYNQPRNLQALATRSIAIMYAASRMYRSFPEQDYERHECGGHLEIKFLEHFFLRPK